MYFHTSLHIRLPAFHLWEIGHWIQSRELIITCQTQRTIIKEQMSCSFHRTGFHFFIHWFASFIHCKTNHLMQNAEHIHSSKTHCLHIAVALMYHDKKDHYLLCAKILLCSCVIMFYTTLSPSVRIVGIP